MLMTNKKVRQSSVRTWVNLNIKRDGEDNGVDEAGGVDDVDDDDDNDG